MAADLVLAGTVDEIRAAGRKMISVGAVPVLVLWDRDGFHALDNRCPHLGFPRQGLEHNLRLVVAKAALEEAARLGATENDAGWRSGLTILSAMTNVLPALAPEDRPRALTQAVAWIAAECAGRVPRCPQSALGGTRRGRANLRGWFREAAEALRRVPSRERCRGVLDAAASVYTPPAPLPHATASASGLRAEAILETVLKLYDKRGLVDEVAEAVSGSLAGGGNPQRLLQALGHAVLREDTDFRSYQQVDTAWRRLAQRGDTREGRLALVAAARWLAARFPTRRAQEQTYRIAWRLHRGATLHEAPGAQRRGWRPRTDSSPLRKLRPLPVDLRARVVTR